MGQLNLFNVYYLDLQKGRNDADEKQVYWRTHFETYDDVRKEIELKQGWAVIFVERIK